MASTTGAEARPMPINIGISEENRREIAEGLSRLLADTYTLYLKTHNYHWNVTGPMFQTLHLMFEQQYDELALAVDLIAERIRALGFPAPATYKQFAALSSIKEEEGVPTADEANDQPTADLLTERMQVHEKTAWMLRSLLAEEGTAAAATTAKRAKSAKGGK